MLSERSDSEIVALSYKSTAHGRVTGDVTVEEAISRSSNGQRTIRECPTHKPAKQRRPITTEHINLRAQSFASAKWEAALALSSERFHLNERNAGTSEPEVKDC